ncbi:MAG: LysR family transcriptional regulator [Pseudomonadota bacterium]
MNEMNFDWDDLRLFLAVARAGGLAPAAKATGTSAPTLGRRMLRLERRLGVELFRRLPRGYELTEDGATFLRRVEGLEAEVSPLVALAQDRRAPLVKVSAGAWVTRLLCRHAAEIEGVRLRFISAEEKLDIGRREAVIGVRNARPREVGLAGRRVATVRFAVFARDVDVTTWAQVLGPAPSAAWVREARGGQDAVEVTSARSALDLALSGAARAVLPVFVGAREGGLVQVSPTIEALEHEQWLVSHHEERFEPEVRRALDRIADVLRREIG